MIAIASRRYTPRKDEPPPPPSWDPEQVGRPRGQDVRWLFAEQRWKQKEIAKRLGCDVSSIRRWQVPDADVPDHVWMALLRARDTDLAETAGLGSIASALDSLRRLPVVGSINAGTPVVVEQLHAEDHELVPADLVRGEAFVLDVHGPSMEPEISDGDRVVIQVDPQPPVGRVVAITVDGETVLRRLRRRRGKMRLEAAAEGYEPITLPTEGVTVHGYVVGLIRRFR